jgi:hypothetical protein
MSQDLDQEEGTAAAASKPTRRRGDPYEVGFARPPKATQFKKGRSGNPRGRPKAAEIVDARGALDRVLQRRITITYEGEPRRVTVLEALLLKVREMAAGGDIAMLKLQLRLIETMPPTSLFTPPDYSDVLINLRMRMGMLDPDEVK